MRLVSFIGALLCCTVFAASARNVRVSTVQYVSGKDTVTAVLTMPGGKGPFPALVVIHEWWGLNDWVKNNAKALAEHGYVALAIDLYRGKSATTADDAHILMRGLPEDRAARDLQAATAFLRSLKEVNPSKVGSVGWCMGGGYSLAAALHDSRLAACVICYGRLVTDSSAIEKIPCPVLGLFGEDDQGITPADVHEFESAGKHAHKDVAVTIYKGAGHAFMNPNNATGYRDSSAENAWARIYSFFDRTLKK